jgi:uncharacterized RDD family membrane protein YckC
MQAGRRASLFVRLAAEVLDWALALATLCVGWLIWFALIAKRGKTPGKALLGVRIHDYATGDVASTKQVWLREIGWKSAIPLIASLLLGAVIDDDLAAALMSIYYLAGALSAVLDSERRAIWDHLSGTEVRKVSSVPPDEVEVWPGRDGSVDDLAPSRRSYMR